MSATAKVADANAALKHMRIARKSSTNEWLVYPVGGPREGLETYYTDDVDDAIDTANYRDKHELVKRPAKQVTDSTKPYHPGLSLKFKNLLIGDTFDFIGGTTFDSFYKRCTKTGKLTYIDEDGAVHKIGSVEATVYHVERQE